MAMNQNVFNLTFTHYIFHKTVKLYDSPSFVMVAATYMFASPCASPLVSVYIVHVSQSLDFFHSFFLEAPIVTLIFLYLCFGRDCSQFPTCNLLTTPPPLVSLNIFFLIVILFSSHLSSITNIEDVEYSMTYGPRLQEKQHGEANIKYSRSVPSFCAKHAVRLVTEPSM